MLTRTGRPPLAGRCSSMIVSDRVSVSWPACSWSSCWVVSVPVEPVISQFCPADDAAAGTRELTRVILEFRLKYRPTPAATARTTRAAASCKIRFGRSHRPRPPGRPGCRLWSRPGSAREPYAVAAEPARRPRCRPAAGSTARRRRPPGPPSSHRLPARLAARRRGGAGPRPGTSPAASPRSSASLPPDNGRHHVNGSRNVPDLAGWRARPGRPAARPGRHTRGGCRRPRAAWVRRRSSASRSRCARDAASSMAWRPRASACLALAGAGRQPAGAAARAGRTGP